MQKMKVGVVGATGMVGQRFLTLLENHPYFEVSALAASARSAGKTYAEAVGDRWKMKTPMPEKYKSMIVHDAAKIDEMGALCSFVFCAVDMKKDEIKALEEAYAKHEIPVVSNNSANRWTIIRGFSELSAILRHWALAPARGGSNKTASRPLSSFSSKGYLNKFLF